MDFEVRRLMWSKAYAAMDGRMEPTGQFFAPAKTAFPPSMAVRCIHGDFAEHEPPHIPQHTAQINAAASIKPNQRSLMGGTGR